MNKGIFELGNLIIKVLIRFYISNDVKQQNCVDIVEMLSSLGENKYNARLAERRIEDIGDRIAESCENILNIVLDDADRREAIIENLTYAVREAKFDNDSIYALSMDPDLIKKLLLNSNRKYKDNLNPDEYEIYERLVDQVAHIIASGYQNTIEFTNKGIVQISKQLDNIEDQIVKILNQLEHINNGNINDYEKKYLETILYKCRYVQLFGVNEIDSKCKKYELSTSYISLSLTSYDNEDRIISQNELPTYSNRIWISGEAGSGKTTYLQRIAVSAITNDTVIKGVNNKIPIFIELRSIDCNKISLQNFFFSVMEDSSYEMPNGWIDNHIKNGRFIFLIDGFDEIPEIERNKVLDWIEKIDIDNRCIKILTARPHVFDEMNIYDYENISIQPMDRKNIRDFISYWHKSVIEKTLAENEDVSQKYAIMLMDHLQKNEALYKLANNPLLCAMICALNYSNQGNIPLKNRNELYEKCCEMLLEGRDVARNIGQEIELSYTEKKNLVSQLAYWMMQNSYVEVEISTAIISLESTLSAMENPQNYSGEKVLSYLLHRSGLLRVPEKDKICFLHRTFQEYLTAYVISKRYDWNFLTEKIGNSLWQETIMDAMFFAGIKEANAVITLCLKKGMDNNADTKYTLLALNYLSQAVEVDKKLRVELNKKVRKFIPPKMNQCRELALSAGELAIPFLESNKEYSVCERLACIRTLRMIDSIKVLGSLKTYFDQVLEFEEICEIGLLLEKHSILQIQQYDMENVFINYIRDQIDTELTISYGMLSLISNLSKKNKKILEKKKIKDISVVGYRDNYEEDYDRYLGEYLNCINRLVLIGDFEGVDIISSFKVINRLELFSLNNNFSIISLLNADCVENLTEVSIYLGSDNQNGSFYRSDMKKFKNCKSFTLIIECPTCEIETGLFDEMENLEELILGGRFVLDNIYEIDIFPKFLKKLVLYVPGWDGIEGKDNINEILERRFGIQSIPKRTEAEIIPYSKMYDHFDITFRKFSKTYI